MLQVEVNDGLPDQVCGKCMTVVRCFYEYRQDCIRHDKILRESLQSLCNFDVVSKVYLHPHVMFMCIVLPLSVSCFLPSSGKLVSLPD